MPDTKLTDLEIITEPRNGDILYIVDVDKDASKQITFSNLVGTKIDSLSTDFIELSTNVMIGVESNDTDITTAQLDISINSFNVSTLSSDAATLSADVANLSANVFIQAPTVSGVDNGNTFSFGTAMVVGSATPITQHVTTFNTQIGDIGVVGLSAEGGLSGLETNFFPISANKCELIISTRVNDDRTITIPANTVFTYFVTRSVIQ